MALKDLTLHCRNHFTLTSKKSFGTITQGRISAPTQYMASTPCLVSGFYIPIKFLSSKPPLVHKNLLKSLNTV